MATFVKHEACPSCGSRDNLGRYSDGSAFCFGCHHYESANISPFVGERDGQTEGSNDESAVEFPADADSTLDERATNWLSSYGLLGREVIHAGLKWSPGWEQLLIPLYDKDGHLCCIQAKNFNPKRASKAKYYNIGDKSLSDTRYGTGTTLVFTEDVLSAIKVGRVATGMPLLGTSIGRSRLAALRPLYERLIVWLDDDKWKEACEIAEAAKFLGWNASTIFTPKDPKEYSTEELQEFLK